MLQSLSRRQKFVAGLLSILFTISIGYLIVSRHTVISPFNTGTIPSYAQKLPAGVENAKLSAVLFCDLSNPECSSVLSILYAFRDEYPNDLELYFRHTISLENEKAYTAAVATEIAKEYNLFWYMISTLYEYQYEWMEAETAALPDYFASYIEETGIDFEEYKQALLNELSRQSSHTKNIQRDTEYALNKSISVPTLYVNNKIIEQPLTYASLLNLLAVENNATIRDY